MISIDKENKIVTINGSISFNELLSYLDVTVEDGSIIRSDLVNWTIECKEEIMYNRDVYPPPTTIPSGEPPWVIICKSTIGF